MSTAGGDRDCVVVGAGSVGLNLAARLRRSGAGVLVVTRRPETAEALSREGVRLSDPAAGSGFSASVESVCGWESLPPERLSGIVLLCMRQDDLDEAAGALFHRQPRATPVCVQNGVGHEARLARRFDRVLGLVVRQTCTRDEAVGVRALGPGRLVVGAARESRDLPGALARRDALATSLAAAGFDTALTPHLEADRWLKLCVNLMSAPNALVRREDHATPAFVELKARLLEEARRALAAGGVEASSCDGRDRSLDAEIAHQRSSLERGTSARALPVYNSVWTALRAGGPLESPRFHRRIVELAERHGRTAPLNRRMIDVLERCAREHLGPECVTAAELLGGD
ncbi:MAG: ketopantoate reductase family protein [Myxococcota bacterium]